MNVEAVNAYNRGKTEGFLDGMKYAAVIANQVLQTYQLDYEEGNLGYEAAEAIRNMILLDIETKIKNYDVTRAEATNPDRENHHVHDVAPGETVVGGTGLHAPEHREE